VGETPSAHRAECVHMDRPKWLEAAVMASQTPYVVRAPSALQASICRENARMILIPNAPLVLAARKENSYLENVLQNLILCVNLAERVVKVISVIVDASGCKIQFAGLVLVVPLDNRKQEGVERFSDKPIIPYAMIAKVVHEAKHKITEVAIKHGI